ncbi:hypothetical protein B0H14DRAFT_3584702 [Mycena olivaceomarginata]|nr:hypothetical protein B0H14DRAFT_3584702 [Mycena olivaceomarginata]
MTHKALLGSDFRGPGPNKNAAAKAVAEIALANLAIVADALRVTETRVQGLSLDVANLTTEVRLRPHTPPRTSSWSDMVELVRCSARCFTISISARTFAVAGPHQVGEIPNSSAGSRRSNSRQSSHGNDLNARLLVLERHNSTLPATAGITATDVQKATVQRFSGVFRDLNVLNDTLYEQGTKQGQINAELRTRIAALEADNTSLRAESVEQGRALAAIQAAIACLEITSAPPLDSWRQTLLTYGGARAGTENVDRRAEFLGPQYPHCKPFLAYVGV